MSDRNDPSDRSDYMETRLQSLKEALISSIVSRRHRRLKFDLRRDHHDR